MKKIIIVIAFFLTACGGIATNNSEDKSIFADIQGSYVCAGDYYKDEFFSKNPQNIPSIAFFSQNKCELKVNYFEGIAVISGVYVIEGENVLVDIELDDTIFEENGVKYMPDSYCFRFISEEQLVVDNGFYGVNDGDIFVKNK